MSVRTKKMLNILPRLYSSIQGWHRPLVEASYQGHVGLVKLLLKYRVDVNATGNVRIGIPCW